MRLTDRTNAVADNLDRYVAILALILGGLSIASLLPTDQSLVYTVLVAYVIIACAVYLIARPRLLAMATAAPSATQKTTRWYVVLNIAFFCLLAYSTMSVALRPQPYTRPLGYFVSMAIMAGLLAVEIALAPSERRYTYLLLLKIMLVGLSLRWMVQAIFPGHVWFDPWYHERFADEILSLSHVPELGLESYSKLPVMHLLVASTMLVTGLDFKTAFMVSVSPLQAIVNATFVYLLASRFVCARRPALLAALLVTVADNVLARGYVPYPTTLAAILMPVILYAVLSTRQRASVALSLISLVLMAALILTHTVVSLAMSILLLCCWWGGEIYKRVYRAPVRRPVTFFLFALFTVAMFSWWMYASGHMLMVARLLRWALAEEHFHAPVPQLVMEYAARVVPISEILLDRAGFSVYYALAAIGCLFVLAPGTHRKDGEAWVLAAGGVTMAVIGFLGPLLSAYILATRWYLLSQILLAIPAALGVIVILSIAGRHTLVLMGALMAAITFSMITDLVANPDSPIFSQTRAVRRALTQSELTSMGTIAGAWRGYIVSDQHSHAYLEWRWDEEIIEINDFLDQRDFALIPQHNPEAVLVIREYICTSPFYARGAVKLDYDPRELLLAQGSSRIYDSGSVTAFRP